MDWINLAAGFAFGVAASVVFFAGLRLGVRVALRTSKPGSVLLLGAAFRISLLLLAGWAAAQIGVWSAIGFSAAFVMVRFAAVTWARAPFAMDGR